MCAHAPGGGAKGGFGSSVSPAFGRWVVLWTLVEFSVLVTWTRMASDSGERGALCTVRIEVSCGASPGTAPALGVMLSWEEAGT